jgi:ElaB/YqjD/DUF883 family membrane-anchored ribosome-binding protein
MTKTTSHRSRVSSPTNGHRDADLKSLITEAKSSLSNVGEHATENLQALKSRLSDTLVGAKARAKTFAKAARRHASRADDKIRANPYQATGIAAGIGLIAGFLIARRRSDAR